MKKKLIKFRIDKEINQTEMAKIIGKSQSVYARKENEEIPFTDKEIRAIKDYFNLTKYEVADLIFED